MVPPAATQGRGGGSSGEDGIDDKDAKHLLDSIGEKVYNEKVKNGGAETYKEELRGNLNKAKGSEETGAFHKTCDIINDKVVKLIDARGERNPCGNATVEYVNRFSKESGGECANSKIKDNYKGSNDKDVGACAPYRRLSLCNKNFKNINNDDSSNAKHNLLLDVCLAAKYEGESLKTYREQYDSKYPGSSFTMCTMLARSFADIGDIIRGKDLYRRDKGKRDKLEDNLKTIFKNIYEKLLEENQKNEKKGEIETRYNDTDKNYYKLREDWWNANRATIWEAITCHVVSGKYFRGTCGNSAKTGTLTPSQCRCGDNPNTDPPTYFDYVPQFLRWFEEWAEDFCRKKKKKVENLQKQCRKKDNSSDDRYCSRNGFDCEKTIRKIELLRMGKGCTDCFFACNPYIDWINNQKEQFDKQKNKYAKEISNSGRQKRSTNNYKGYDTQFYEILKSSNVGGLDKFLGLLSKEEACQAVKDGGTIHFAQEHGDNSIDKGKGTFYRSEYCQPCPLCGVKKVNNGGSGGNTEWKRKEDMKDCPHINLYKPINDTVGTPITILKSGEGEKDIAEKLEAFCLTQSGKSGKDSSIGSGDCGDTNNSDKDPSLCEPWKCYEIEELTKDNKPESEEDKVYDNDVKTGGGLCILQKKNDKGVQKQKTFHNFFYYWVAHMLKDSIHWRTKKLEKCLEKAKKGKCKEECKKECECFLKWIEQKEKEWDPIKQQFRKQKDLPMDPGEALEWVLRLEFANENTDEDKKNNVSAQEAKEIKHLSEMLQETADGVASGDGGTGAAPVTEQKNIMDKLINYEKKEAKTCLDTHKSDPCPKPKTNEGPLRSDTSHNELQPLPPPAPEEQEEGDSESDSENEEQEVEDDEDGDEVEEEAEATAEDTTEDAKDQEEVEEENVEEEETVKVEEPTQQEVEETKEEEEKKEEEEEHKEEENDVVNGEVSQPKTQQEEKSSSPATAPAPPAEEPASPAESEKKPEEKATVPAGTPPSTPAAPKKPAPKQPKQRRIKTLNVLDHPAVIPSLVTSTLAWSVGIGFATFTYFYLKKKTKRLVDLFSVINIPKGDYDIPTKLSPNRYIPYTSGKYRGKRYIYLEGDSGTDSGYTDHYSDITSSSESEYEELDINDIYVPHAPKYKTLIEVVLEPSGNNTTASGNNTTASGNNTTASGNNTTASGNNTTASDTQNDDIPNDGIPSSKITDNEWNTLKDEFISNMLQNEPKDVPQYDVSTELPMNIGGNVLDDGINEKPFITSIHDRNLYSGEEYSYNVNMVNNDIPISGTKDTYSGIDLINDSLSGNKHIDIYDELLKRKENELFGTEHPKRTSTYSVAKLTNSDPIHNQLELFHKWLDRHRNMCEKWNNKEDVLDKLKELWENETHSGNTHPSDSNKTLNTDVSIQIHMDNPKPINEFTYVDSNPNQVDDTYVDSNPDNSSMDTILEDLDKYNEPYYDVQDDIYYDVNDQDVSTVDTNAMDVPSKVQIEMDINTKLVKEKYPIADVWDI
ncbi:erythrocyte membrane protein 1 [Plasmodium falciparum IGH-CR14]|uniref:Erythrocyte membrane protein 1 n=1 Tax=Plasmodium falciparum IGH-CR14 TaxID=580059 RepID=A0A0L1I998_PLAFA|nr:erythrocyte membrane protein 1 [Plasmodium falciparum IGH-CR14]